MNPELWLRNPILTLLSWLPVPLGVVALWLPSWPPVARRLARPWASVAFYALTRPVFAALVFGVLGHHSTDWMVNRFQGEQVLAGGVPYRDFHTLFAPGLPYLFALALLVSRTWGLIVLFMIADLVAFLALARLSRRADPSPLSPAWAYLAFPPVWYFQSRYAQDETLAAMFLAAALLLLARGRQPLAGLALAAGQLFTKLLFGLAALAVLVTPGTSWGLRLAYLLPVGVVYGLLAVLGLPWQANLALQASSFGSGPVLWRLPALWWGLDLGRLAPLPFAIVLVVGWLRLWRRRADHVDFVAWIWGCYALLAPKLLPMYAVMVAPALALWVTRGGDREARWRWWGLYGLALGTAWYADSGPVQGLFGPIGVALGAAGVLLPAALALWLLVAVWRDPGPPAGRVTAGAD